MKIIHQQIFKFILTCILAVAGIIAYVMLGGTLFKALCIYLVFAITSKIANVAYHRWLAHNYIEPGKFGKIILLYAIVASALVKPGNYIIGHRAHHRYPDSDKDPHPPSIGLWNALIGNFNNPDSSGISIRDVYRKKEIMFVHNYFYKLHALTLIAFWFIDTDFVLLSFALLNLRFLIGVTIFNYISHGGAKQLGAQNLPTWTNYILGYAGEQLHKNHHDHPSDANFGRTSTFNFDIGYQLLKHVVKIRK